MITLIEALNYRCLRYVRAPLGRFSLLVGPSGSGKSTLMDVPALLSDLVRLGPEAAVAARASDPRELLWNGEGDGFELAVEAALPGGVPRRGDPPMDSVRYQVEIRVGADGGAVLSSETLMLTRGAGAGAPEPAATMFPVHPAVPDSILSSVQRHDNRAVVNRGPGGTDYFHPEAGGDRDGQWDPSFPLGPRRSALGHLMDDAESYPAATWMRDHLAGGIGRLSPDPGAMRRPGRPHRGAAIAADGSNLPGLVEALRRDHPGRHREWVRRLATVLPGLSDISAAPRPPGESAALVYSYEGGRTVPARLASSGELRLSALALAGRLPGPPRLYFVEGPEADLHEGAIAAVLEWLRSAGDSQVMAATHSATLEASAAPGELLRLSRTEDGGTLLTAGAVHLDPGGDPMAGSAPDPPPAG